MKLPDGLQAWVRPEPLTTPEDRGRLLVGFALILACVLAFAAIGVWLNRQPPAAAAAKSTLLQLVRKDQARAPHIVGDTIIYWEWDEE